MNTGKRNGKTPAGRQTAANPRYASKTIAKKGKYARSINGERAYGFALSVPNNMADLSQENEFSFGIFQ
jgi:hypothetical protein